jgi:hypothetical protein
MSVFTCDCLKRSPKNWNKNTDDVEQEGKGGNGERICIKHEAHTHTSITASSHAFLRSESFALLTLTLSASLEDLVVSSGFESGLISSGLVSSRSCATALPLDDFLPMVLRIEQRVSVGFKGGGEREKREQKHRDSIESRLCLSFLFHDHCRFICSRTQLSLLSVKHASSSVIFFSGVGHGHRSKQSKLRDVFYHERTARIYN